MSHDGIEHWASDCGPEDLVDRPLSRPIHAAGRRLCLFAPLDPARGLSLSLLQHLAEELPELDFSLRPGPAVEAIWLCGYEPGHAARVRALRGAHPRASLLVTGRAPREAWEREVRAAGADHVAPWPLGVRELGRFLRAAPASERERAID